MARRRCTSPDLAPMEYTADLRGELVFMGLVSRRIREQHRPLSSGMMSDQAPKERKKPLPGSMSDRILKPLCLGTMPAQAPKERENPLSGSMSDQILMSLSLGTMSN